MPTTIDGANGVNNVALGTVLPNELSVGAPTWDTAGNLILGTGTGNNHIINGSISLTKDLSLQGVINQNSISSIASAATVNLNTSTSNVINITGTTTITSFTLSIGRERTLVFTGSLTLTNSASLILPGGVNIITKAGDTLNIVGEAGGTRVLNFIRSEVRPYETFKAFYESPPQTITAAGTLSLTHGLGSAPTLVALFLQNITSELGYTPGDIVTIPAGVIDANASYGTGIKLNSTNLEIKYGSAASVYYINNFATGVVTNITPANWRTIFRAWA